MQARLSFGADLPIIRIMRPLYFFVVICFLLMSVGFAHPQNEDEDDGGYDWSAVPAEDAESSDYVETPEFLNYMEGGEKKSTDDDGGTRAELPRSFRHIFLGIGLEGLKVALRDDTIFNFREDRDVSFLPSDKEQTLVETQGFSFIRRAFFQLRYGEVFIMSFTLDTALVDHYSVFTTFLNRYGDPTSLNPQETVWESEGTRVSIERDMPC